MLLKAMLSRPRRREVSNKECMLLSRRRKREICNKECMLLSRPKRRETCDKKCMLNLALQNGRPNSRDPISECEGWSAIMGTATWHPRKWGRWMRKYTAPAQAPCDIVRPRWRSLEFTHVLGFLEDELGTRHQSKPSMDGWMDESSTTRVKVRVSRSV
uniref:Uncharacterized protein n=1 Tax=Physcomitrium patens TaxID=3218 RepID=A0A2K1KHL9_PHYPA|nr:hypothetical protein PHYPA_009657 [Physcomitrium patens]